VFSFLLAENALELTFMSRFIPATCNVDFTMGDLNSRAVSCKSGIFSHHVLSVEKVFISLEVFIINDSSKMYVK
jgi:hypothetical protein